jgi:hypothetical protein
VTMISSPPPMRATQRDPNASIDDLLEHEQERAPKEPRSAGDAVWWVHSALIGGALTVVTVVGLRLFGVALQVFVILAGFLALLSLRRVIAQVTPPPPSRQAHRRSDADDGTYHWGEQDALRTAVNRWERALGWAQGDRDRFAERVLPTIGELADERLRQRYGLTRASDPDRARELLGEPLWQLLTAPARRPPTPRELAAIVAPLEKL